jgi:hypothetical protein
VNLGRVVRRLQLETTEPSGFVVKVHPGGAPDGLAVVGVRCWWPRRDGQGTYWLSSPIHEMLWPVGEPAEALCDPQDLRWTDRRLHVPIHGAPNEACACGVYGVFLTRALSVENAVGTLRRSINSAQPLHLGVIGIVEGFGHVVLSDKGWRAERARPLALFPPPPFSLITPGTVTSLAECYGLPILPAIPQYRLTDEVRANHLDLNRTQPTHQERAASRTGT